MSGTDPAAPAPDGLDPIQRAAVQHAKLWNLVCDNGQIVCLRKDCGVEATLPSLLCQGHLAAVRRGFR